MRRVFIPFMFLVVMPKIVFGMTECQIINLMPAYWTFQQAVQEQTDVEQARLFREIIQLPNAAVYAAIFASSRKPLEERLQRWQGIIKDIQPRIRQVDKNLTTELPVLIADFRKNFPDFECTVPVYFLPSVGSFDGAIRQVDDKSVLLFGIDMIASYHGDNAKPLITHELFHVYHEQASGTFPDEVYWGLWVEGLASYVSKRLNPDVPVEKICCLPEAAPIEQALPEIVHALLSVLDSTDKDDYERFFMGGADTGFPQRSGYYLGYRIAKRLGESHTLDELARLEPAKVRTLVERELQSLIARNRDDGPVQ